MQSYFKPVKNLLVLALAGSLFTACSFHKKKYENPITKDTLQPDKVLFDRSITDIEHGRYEVARLTLNTLINTYDASEYLAKAKLAIADSWYREGGAHGLAQAEAEYKDFILFYPAMEEAAESQWKVCQIHYKQMEKADRDSAQAIRTEDECRVLVTQFPNSKYIPQAQQMLRDTQEVLGQKEFLTAAFYHTKGAYPAAANRASFVADQYPLFSGADEALWQAADSFRKMGDRFEGQAADDYTRIVRDYPLSPRAAAAKGRLEDMKRPVPPADPAAVARMKYEEENRTKRGLFSKSLGVFSGHPDAHLSAKTGAPAMTTMRPPTPVSVPSIAAVNAANSAAAGTAGATNSDVAAQVTTDTSGIDSKPDARQGGAAGAASGTAAGAPATGTTPAAATGAQPPAEAQQQPLPSNRQFPKPKKKSKKQLKQEQDALLKQQQAQAAAAAAKPPMSRVLLADDSPHAQRMGERILREEGFEVITVSDGETAMLRLKDANPDLVIADISMPGVTGYQVCDYVKTSGNHPHTRVVLTASAMEPFDEAEVARVRPDGMLKKPFEASLLVAAATAARVTPAQPAPVHPGRGVVVLDPEQVRAAVTLALDASLASLTDQITEKVLVSLNLKPYAR